MKTLQYLIPVLILFGMVVSADCAQYILYNDTYTWDGAFNVTCKDPKPGPANWLSPDNYKDGKIFIRYEVSGKPNDRLIGMMFGYWEHSGGWSNYSEQWAYIPNTPNHATCWNGDCNFGTDFATDGVYYACTDGFRFIWGYPSSWTDPVTQVCFNFWDAASGSYLQTNACGPNCFKGGDVRQFCPFTIKLQAVHVSQGSVLSIPPEFSNDWNGCPADWAGNITATALQSGAKQGQGAISISRISGGYLMKAAANGRHTFEISSLSGRSVSRGRTDDNGQCIISQSGAAPGIYVIRLSNGKTMSQQSVVLR
jgi:hypothetical protein